MIQPRQHVAAQSEFFSQRPEKSQPAVDDSGDCHIDRDPLKDVSFLG